MANYKIVDADQLDADMATVADAIRAKGGTSDPLAWPDGYKTAVEAIAWDTSAEDGLLAGTLTEYRNERITKVQSYGFFQQVALTDLDLPNVTQTGTFFVAACTSLVRVNIPKVQIVQAYSFQYCSMLEKLDILAASSINVYAMQGCEKLSALILRNANVVLLTNVNALSATPIASGTGYIYVPAARVDTYKADSVWSTYANQFRALEDYTVDGTTTGELDETKI